MELDGGNNWDYLSDSVIRNRRISNSVGEAGGDSGMPPPLPPLKPEWRHHMSISTAQGLRNNSCDMEDDDEDEEAIPNDSLYGTQVNEGLSIL